MGRIPHQTHRLVTSVGQHLLQAQRDLAVSTAMTTRMAPTLAPDGDQRRVARRG